MTTPDDDNIEISSMKIPMVATNLDNLETVRFLGIAKPCRKAYLELYAKNIEVLDGYASREEDLAYLTINYNTLSQVNKNIANTMVELDLISIDTFDKKNMTFKLAITGIKNKSDDDISNKLITLGQFFAEQDVLYGRIKAQDMMKDFLSYITSLGFTEITLDNAPDDIKAEYFKNRIYDESTGDYFVSKLLFDKHKDFVKRR